MAKNVVNQIRKATRRRFSAEEKIRIVLEGLTGRDSGHRAVPSRGDSAPIVANPADCSST